MSFVPPARHLLRAKDLADARYFEPLGVSDLARAAGLSRAHFSREFRGAFGESPHAYLLTRRLRAGGGAAARHGPLGRRRLLIRGPAERRLVHHQLHPHVRGLADRLPRRVPARRPVRPDPGLRATGDPSGNHLRLTQLREVAAV
jgi:Bacterial regulatory helix-turn-helix proteins, AraC family